MLWLLRAVPPSGQKELTTVQGDRKEEAQPEAAHSLPLVLYNLIFSLIAIPAASRLETGLADSRKGCFISMVGRVKRASGILGDKNLNKF